MFISALLDTCGCTDSELCHGGQGVKLEWRCGVDVHDIVACWMICLRVLNVHLELGAMQETHGQATQYIEGDDSRNEHHGQCLDKARAAIRAHTSSDDAVLKIVCVGADSSRRTRGRLVSCRCHGGLMQFMGSYAKRRSVVADYDGNTEGRCPWDGGRLVELTMGHSQQLIDERRGAVLPPLHLLCTRASHDARGHVLVAHGRLNLAMSEQVSLKWRHDINCEMPYGLLAGVAQLCGGTMAEGRA